MLSTFLVITLFTAVVIFVGCLTTLVRSSHPRGRQHPMAPSAGVERNPRQAGAGLTKAEAEDLLDWLEANGQRGELTFVPGEGFLVR